MSDAFDTIRQQEDRVLLPTYAKFPLAFERGSGVYLWDSSRRRYLDFYGGHAVALVGHCHKKLVEAVRRQAEKLTFYSNVCYLEVRAEAASVLRELLYDSVERIFFVNSGAEANEAALKIARSHTGRERIVAMKNGFHGRTVACLSVTGIDRYRTSFVPNLAGSTDFIPFGDLEALKDLQPEKIAGIILEPIQSMAGAVTAPPGYFKALREFTWRHGIVLIFDEVQTAIGRTGEAFCGMHWQVEPDIVTMAKGIGGGIPAAACAVGGELAAGVSVGDHGSTFGGGPVACAAVKATCEIIRSEGLIEQARRVGTYLQERLREVPYVKEVRGMGLLVGFLTDRTAKELQKALLQRGIVVGTSVDPQVVRLLPPLCVETEHVDVLIEELKKL